VERIKIGIWLEPSKTNEEKKPKVIKKILDDKSYMKIVRS